MRGAASGEVLRNTCRHAGVVGDVIETVDVGAVGIPRDRTEVGRVRDRNEAAHGEAAHEVLGDGGIGKADASAHSSQQGDIEVSSHLPD